MPPLVIAAVGTLIAAAIFSENSKKSQDTNADVMHDAMQYGYDIKHTSKYTDAYGNTSYSEFEFTNPRNQPNQPKQMTLFMFINNEWVPANFTADGIPLPNYNPSLPMTWWQFQIYSTQRNQGIYPTRWAFEKPILPPGYVEPNWVYADKELQDQQIKKALEIFQFNKNSMKH
jgi:hypothetical protein